MARVSATARAPQPVDDVNQTVREYLRLKAEGDKIAKQQKSLRDSLMETIEKAGYEDDLGHMWIDLDEDVAGTAAIQRQRRVSRSLDAAAAEETLTGLGLWDECTTMVRVIDEDKIYAALYDEKLNEADIDCIFPQSVTYALVPKK